MAERINYNFLRTNDAAPVAGSRNNHNADVYVVELDTIENVFTILKVIFT